MNRIGRDDAARYAEEARRRAEELSRARSQTPATPPAVADAARTARPAPEDVLERAPRLFGREIDLPAAPPRVVVPPPPPPPSPPPEIPSGPRTDVLPRLASGFARQTPSDADLDRQVLFAAFGAVVSPVTEVIVSAPQALVAVKRVLWSEIAPALFKDKLAAIADKAGSIETRATMVKEALLTVDTRVARTVVGFQMAGGFLEKAAYKAGVARELSQLAPGAETSLERMAAARQQFVAAQQHAGDAADALRELAPRATETPWALGEIRGIQQAAGSARVELSRTESRGQMLAEMDAGTGLLAEAPTPDAAAAAPAAGPRAEVEFGQEDLARIGSALDPTKPPVQNDWSEQMVNTVCDLGRQQGGVTDEQGGRNFELARTVLATDGATGVKELGAADLAAVLKMSGVDLGKVDPNQLQSAAKYVSGATTLEEQQDKLRKTIDNFQVLEKIGLPKLSRQQMVDELWGVAKVPGHALAKLSDADVAKKLQEVLGTVNAGPGKSEIKIGKYNLKLEVGRNGTVEKSSCKKPSFFSKIVKITKIVTPIALTVLSFIPITAPFALAAQGVISMVQAIKAKSLLGIATAAASLAGAGGAIVSKFAGAAAKAAGVASKAAATAARAAKVMKVANSASRALQGVSSLKSGNVIGGLASIGSGIASGMSTFASKAAKGLGKFADNLNKVSTKLSAVGAGVASFEGYKKASQALSAAKEGLQAAQASGDPRAIAAAQKRLNQAESQKRAALIGGAAGAASAASAWTDNRSLFPGQSKQVSPATAQLQQNLRLASQALGLAQGVAGKDYAAAAVSALSLGATRKNPPKPDDEKRSQTAIRLNQAANLAQAELGYYQAEKGRKAANQAVTDAQTRLDAAKRGGNAEAIRHAESDLKKAKGGAESALMGGIAAGASLLGTARDIGKEYEKEKAEKKEKVKVAQKAASDSTIAGRKTAEGLGALAKDENATPHVQETARAEQENLQAADKKFQKAVADAKGDADKINVAVNDFEKVRKAAVSHVLEATRTASAAPATGTSAASEAGSPGLASMRRPQRIGAAQVTKDVTVWEVSQRTGVPVERILEFNAQSGNTLDPHHLQIGQQILVPLDAEDVKFKPLSAEQVRDLKQKGKPAPTARSGELEYVKGGGPSKWANYGLMVDGEPVLVSAKEELTVHAGLTEAQAADGFIIGANGKRYTPGTALVDVEGVRVPGASSALTFLFFNGIDNSLEDHYNSLLGISRQSGGQAIGVYNATEGVGRDLLQSAGDKIDVGTNRAVATMTDLVYSELTNPARAQTTIRLLGHSQGGLDLSRMVDRLFDRLTKEDGRSSREAEQALSRLHIDTFGAAAWRYRNGPDYHHYMNMLDPVPSLVGLSSPEPGIASFTHAGRGAQQTVFIGVHLNPHSFVGAYLPHWQAPTSNEPPR